MGSHLGLDYLYIYITATSKARDGTVGHLSSCTSANNRRTDTRYRLTYRTPAVKSASGLIGIHCVTRLPSNSTPSTPADVQSECPSHHGYINYNNYRVPIVIDYSNCNCAWSIKRMHKDKWLFRLHTGIKLSRDWKSLYQEEISHYQRVQSHSTLAQVQKTSV